MNAQPRVTRVSVFSLIIFSVASAPCGFSQITDVSQTVATALAAYGPVPVTSTVQVPSTRRICAAFTPCRNITVLVSKTVTAPALLQASNIRVVKSAAISYGTPVSRELPDHMTVDDYLARNCTSAAATPTFTVSTSFQRTASVSLSHTISHTKTEGVGVSASFMGFGASGSLSFANGTSDAKVVTDGTSATVQTTRTGSQSVPPDTFLMIELQTWPVHYTVPFNTTATVDADLSSNDKGYTLLSNILNEAQRTFPISGTIEADDASSGVLVFYDLPFNQSLCPAGSDQTQGIAGYVPSAKTKLTARQQ